MRWNPDHWFGSPEPMTIGVECEMVIFDAEENRLLTQQRFNKADRCFRRLPANIWKDYYPYQLELRTDPQEDPMAAIRQLQEFYRMADAEFQKENLFIVPVPWTGMNDDSFCGLHVHIRYKDEKANKQYYERAWNAYPFILALADHTKNAESSDFEASVRLAKSHHIKVPYSDRDRFWIGSGEHRYRDITVNNLKNNPEDPKKTVKSVVTLETRIFDTPSLLDHLRLQIEGTYYIFSRIKPDAPIIKQGVDQWIDKIGMTRALAIQQRYGMNKVLRESNFNVVEGMCNHFGIPFPSETQFEFREQFVGLGPTHRKLVMRRFSWGQ